VYAATGEPLPDVEVVRLLETTSFTGYGSMADPDLSKVPLSVDVHSRSDAAGRVVLERAPEVRTVLAWTEVGGKAVAGSLELNPKGPRVRIENLEVVGGRRCNDARLPTIDFEQQLVVRESDSPQSFDLAITPAEIDAAR